MPTIYQAHEPRLETVFFISLALRLCRRSRGVWALHNSRFDHEFAHRPFFIRPLLRFVHPGIVIVVDNEENVGRVKRLGLKNRTLCIPEHLGIPREAEDAPLPSALEAFLSSHSPVLMATVTRPSLHDNVDLYGMDLCSEMASRLRETHRNLGLVITVLRPDEGNAALYRAWKASDVVKGLSDHLYLQEGALPSPLPLMSRADLVLRPTCTDGNSMLVNEALALGKTVVASDCVPRPEGCRLFKNRDLDEFTRATREALESPRATPSPPTDQFPRFLELYEELARGKP